jgi:hypothetical protein
MPGTHATISGNLPYLDVDMNSSGGDFARSAVSHPVFLLQNAAAPG